MKGAEREGGVLEQREQSHILKGEGEEILILPHPGPTEKIIQSKQAHSIIYGAIFYT